MGQGGTSPKRDQSPDSEEMIRNCRKLISWRASLLNGTNTIAEKKSFLW